VQTPPKSGAANLARHFPGDIQLRFSVGAGGGRRSARPPAAIRLYSTLAYPQSVIREDGGNSRGELLRRQRRRRDINSARSRRGHRDHRHVPLRLHRDRLSGQPGTSLVALSEHRRVETPGIINELCVSLPLKFPRGALPVRPTTEEISSHSTRRDSVAAAARQRRMFNRYFLDRAEHRTAGPAGMEHGAVKITVLRSERPDGSIDYDIVRDHVPRAEFTRISIDAVSLRCDARTADAEAWVTSREQRRRACSRPIRLALKLIRSSCAGSRRLRAHRGLRSFAISSGCRGSAGLYKTVDQRTYSGASISEPSPFAPPWRSTVLRGGLSSLLSAAKKKGG